MTTILPTVPPRANPRLAAGRAALAAVGDALLPQTCVGCGAWIAGGTGAVCATCGAELSAVAALPYCGRCGRTLPTAAIHEDACARCRTEAFWNVRGVARVGIYTPALRQIALDLKYRGHERSAEYLAGLLAEALRGRAWLAEVEALVPVPMHWFRRLQRPCDHAQLLAEALGRRLRLPVVRLVRRARHSPSQTGMLSKAARFENVKGCFATPWWWGWARWRPGGTSVAGRTVCIVDNLITAGATVHEVSKVLRRAGARRIYAATVVRTPAPGDPALGLPVEAP